MEKYIQIQYAQYMLGFSTKPSEVIVAEHSIKSSEIPTDAVAFVFLEADSIEDANKKLDSNERLPIHYLVRTGRAVISPIKDVISNKEKGLSTKSKRTSLDLERWQEEETLKALRLFQESGCDLCIQDGPNMIQCVRQEDTIVDAKTREILYAPRLKNQG